MALPVLSSGRVGFCEWLRHRMVVRLPSIAGTINGVELIKFRVYGKEFPANPLYMAGNGLIIDQYIGIIHELRPGAHVSGMPDQ